MDVYNVLKNRRSVRKYKSIMPTRTVILKILDAANWAPSGMNEQPWEFVVAAGCKLDEIRDICRTVINLRLPPEADRNDHQHGFARWYSTLGSAPLAILFTCPREEDPARRKMVLESVSAAIQNTLLAAAAEELGTCWMTGPLMKHDLLRETLGIPESREIVAMTPLGYPDETPAPPPRTDGLLERKITWIGF